MASRIEVIEVPVDKAGCDNPECRYNYCRSHWKARDPRDRPFKNYPKPYPQMRRINYPSSQYRPRGVCVYCGKEQVIGHLGTMSRKIVVFEAIHGLRQKT